MTPEPGSAGIAVEPGRIAGRGVPAATVGLRVFFCTLVLLLGPMAWWQRHGWPVLRSIPPSSFLEHGGAAFQVAIPVSVFAKRLSDGADNGNLSDLRLFQGGRELGPNHTPAGAIESHGGGAFNDWEGSVVLSTPDNGDPRHDGLLYSAVYRAYPSAAAQAVYVAVCALTALMCAEAVLLAGLGPWRSPVQWTSVQVRHAATTALLYGTSATLVALTFHGLYVRAVLSPGIVGPFGGSAYIAGLPKAIPPLFSGSGDDVPGGSWSDLRMTEDGRPLGPSHASHAQIRTEGAGAYVHWGEDVVFSAADDSDPRDNGRTYRVAYRVFLIPALAAWGLALCGVGIMLRFSLRWRGVAGDEGSRPRLFQTPMAAEGGVTASLFRPLSLLRVGSLVLAYTAALLLLYGSLVARRTDTGGFKINFEYKAF